MPNNNTIAYDNNVSNPNIVDDGCYLVNTLNNISEEEWINLLFLISDTQTWLDEMQTKLIYQLPVRNKRKLLRRSYYLSACALAHILERHYFKISRYPNAGKFTISVATIVAFIRDAFTQTTASIINSCNLQRSLDTKQIIGFDKYGKTTSIITVVSNAGGRIITAFPGTLNSSPAL